MGKYPKVTYTRKDGWFKTCREIEIAASPAKPITAHTENPSLPRSGIPTMKGHHLGRPRFRRTRRPPAWLTPKPRVRASGSAPRVTGPGPRAESQSQSESVWHGPPAIRGTAQAPSQAQVHLPVRNGCVSCPRLLSRADILGHGHGGRTGRPSGCLRGALAVRPGPT